LVLLCWIAADDAYVVEALELFSLTFFCCVDLEDGHLFKAIVGMR
jgi:hypothetical protein